MNAAKRSRSSRQIREAVDFETWPRPASSQSDSTSRIERPRTKAPTTIAFSGSVVSSRFEPRGNSFEVNGSAASRSCGSSTSISPSADCTRRGRQPFRFPGGAPVSGHIFRVERKRGPQWHAKWRDLQGQHQNRFGPAWTKRGRPPDGYFTKTTAQAALDEILADARRGRLTGRPTPTGVSFADAAAEFLRWIEHDRERKRSTLNDYRSAVNAHLLPAFGHLRLEEVTTAAVDAWRAQVVIERRLANKTVNKVLAVLRGILERARKLYGLPANPVSDVEKQPRKRVNINVYSGEEVWALVRAAASEQDAALFLTAAFTGLRMGELLALRWRDVDFDRQSVQVKRELHPWRARRAEERSRPLAAVDRPRRLRARQARPARALRRSRRSRARRRRRWAPRCLRAPPTLQASPGGGGASAPAVP
jgi:integrase